MLAASAAVTDIPGLVGLILGATGGVLTAWLKMHGEIRRLKLTLEAERQQRSTARKEVVEDRDRVEEKRVLEAHAAALAALRQAAGSLVTALEQRGGTGRKLRRAREAVDAATADAGGALAGLANQLAQADSLAAAQAARRALLAFEG